MFSLCYSAAKKKSEYDGTYPEVQRRMRKRKNGMQKKMNSRGIIKCIYCLWYDDVSEREMIEGKYTVLTCICLLIMKANDSARLSE